MGTGAILPSAHTAMEGRVSSPIPMAMGTAARSSIRGTMEIKNTERYFSNILSPITSVSKNLCIVAHFPRGCNGRSLKLLLKIPGLSLVQSMISQQKGAEIAQCRGGASRSESKSIDCRGQSHHNSIGNLSPAALKI